jgi:hypothetical protein
MRRTRWQWAVVIAVAALALAGCDGIAGGDEDSGDGNGDGDVTPLEFTGASGETVDLTGTWGHGCYAEEGKSSDDPRTLSGDSLVFTIDDWISVEDCSGDSDFTSVYDFTISVDKEVEVTGWIDNQGNSGAAAPEGLEDATIANGMTWTVNSATATPNTQAGADGLNSFSEDGGAVGYCGFTDWAAGESKDILDCFMEDAFGGESEAKGTWLVDDITGTLGIYEDEGTALDEDGYPTEIDNFDPAVEQ